MKWRPVENDVDRRRGRSAPAVAAWVVFLLLVAVWQVPVLRGAEDDAAVERPPRMGAVIRVALPITGNTVERVEQFARRAIGRARAEKATPVLIFEFQVPPDQEEFAKDTKFNDAWKLADILSGEELGAAQTVAYVPQSLPGHAVLVALACDDIIMAGDAELGPVGARPEKIGGVQRIAYGDIADRRKTVPAEVARWLLDPSQDVWVVQIGVARKCVTEDGLKALEQQGQPITSKQKLFDAENAEQSVTQQRGVLTGEEARRLTFVQYLARSRQDMAKALDLPPAAVEEDLSLVSEWLAVRVDLKGPVSADTVNQAQHQMEKKIQEGNVNFICLWIDSGGGSPTDSKRFADFLSTLDPGRVRTVAYIPSKARSDAALVALACHQVVMHPRAELGGSGEYGFSQEEIDYTRETIRDKNGPWKGKPWSLIAAMIDPKLKVFRCTRPGEVGYFCDEELEELEKNDPNGKKWQRGMEVTRRDHPLLLDGERAVEYGLADLTVDGFAEFKQYYRLQDDPTLLEPGWADFLVEALASPGVAALLLTIAFVAMYAELHAPGIGVGAFVATVCFLLFFWSHYLGGTAGWLEIMLFLAGVACLLLEVFVLPGFGIFGLGGGCLVLVSLVLASQTFVVPQNEYQFGQLQRSLLTIAAAGVGIVAAAVLLRRVLPNAPILNRLMLTPPAGEEAETIKRRESLVDLDDFVGARGVTTTQLTPSGKAHFGDMLVDVITDGDVLPRGTKIEVVEVHGNRVIVKAVDDR